MTTINEIQDAVSKLPNEQLTQFRLWFGEFDAQIWDEQFELDVQCGRLDRFAEEALADLDERKCTAL